MDSVNNKSGLRVLNREGEEIKASDLFTRAGGLATHGVCYGPTRMGMCAPRSIDPCMDEVRDILDKYRVLVIEAPTFYGKTHWGLNYFGRESFVFHEDDMVGTDRVYRADFSRCDSEGVNIVDEEKYLSARDLKQMVSLSKTRYFRFIFLTQSYKDLMARVSELEAYGQSILLGYE